MKNAICLIIDRLQPGFIGAYGNGWVDTQSLDRLACEGFVADRFLVNSTSLDDFYRSVWDGVHPSSSITDTDRCAATLPQLCTQYGIGSTLITDVAELTDSPTGQLFGTRVISDRVRPTRPADEPDQCSLYARFADILNTLDESLNNADGKPQLIWAHLRAMDDVWDAPIEARARFHAAGDPEPYEGVELPSIVLPDDFDPDVPLPFVHAYAAQVELLDICLGGLLELLQTDPRFADTLFLLASPRGIPLGEHRHLGPSDDPENPDPLYEESIHTPLMIRLPDGECAMDRSSAMLCPTDIYATLADWFQLPGTAGLEPTDAESDRKTQQDVLASGSILPIARGERAAIRDRILMCNEISGELAVCTPAWFARFVQHVDEAKTGDICTDTTGVKTSSDPEKTLEQPHAELYAKPDDRWEVNDVADRCEDVVQMIKPIRDDLLGRLSGEVEHDKELPTLAPLLIEGYE